MEAPIITGVKLKFGDEALIKLQKKYQAECAEKEKIEKDRKEGKLKKYKVRLDFHGTTEIEVEATDKKQAEEIAMDDPDVMDSNDIDFEVWTVDEL